MTTPNDTIARLWAFAAVLRPPGASFAAGVAALAPLVLRQLGQRLGLPELAQPPLPACADPTAQAAVLSALASQPWVTMQDPQAPSVPPRQPSGTGHLQNFIDVVLSAAASGRLTAAWRKEQRCEAPPVRWTPWSSTTEAPPWSLPETWLWVRVADVLGRTGLVGDGDRLDLADNGVRAVLADEIGLPSFRPLSTPPQVASDSSAPLLALGDVLVGREGSPLGRACVFPGLGVPAMPGPGVTVVRGDSALLRSEALAILLSAVEARRQWGAPSRGRVQRRGIQTLRVPLPPLAEQGELVRRVPALLGRAAQLGLYLDLLAEQAGRRSDAVLQALCCDGGPGDPVDRLLATPLAADTVSAAPVASSLPRVDQELLLRDPYGALKQLLALRGTLRNQEVQEELNMDAAAARGLLQLLVADGLARVEGSKRGTRYVAVTPG
jgi:hypothetical protein